MTSRLHARSILEMVAASFAFALMIACVKAARELPFLEIVFFRSLFGLAAVLPLLASKRAPLLGRKEERVLVLRGLAGFLALMANFYAITRLPIAMAAILTHTGPIFVVLMASAFLAEKVTARHFALVGVCLLGVLLLVGAGEKVSGGAPFDFFACLIAVLSGFFAAVAMVAIRAAGEEESPYTIIFHFVGISTLGALPFVLAQYVRPTPQEWLALVGVGIFSHAGQLGITHAYQRTDASVVTPFSYATPVFSYLLGVLFWKEALTPLACLGGGLILAASVKISRDIRLREE